LLYSRSCRSSFVSEIYSQVHPLTKTPIFSEEWKVLLPPSLTDRHHLLVTYYSVAMKSKTGGREVPQLYGYSVLPLWSNGRFALGTVSEDEKLEKAREKVAREKDINSALLGNTISVPVILCSKLEPGYLNVR